MGQELQFYEDKRYQGLDPSESVDKKEGNTDYFYLVNRNELRTQCLTFILVDGWQEGIPNATEVTGVAFRYDAPQTEAPNAIIIAVPPYKNPSAIWNMNLLANTLVETIELMQIRMVGSEECLGNHQLQKYLPALLFAPDGEGKPLFPSRNLPLYDFEIGDPFLYVPAIQISADELTGWSGSRNERTNAPETGTSEPEIGDRRK